ncbi:MAG: NADH:ubiquinone reductase (Na(+)-transporting) subunit C [Bacteroidia bacterium]|nr:NADH:ubiquinone reductase (Na(+)-transporting) subunit C [Bacteroidales bacterium]NCD41747.1 NADH:ubiquinone reductase (Na(+)-transporting) subunit C [Bacteroidia bacterium]MDD2322025.1 NADH:ubiquinone reductase (Na(+)-transporting) subunit C [Bacteroidales bacterium]MDD3009981.1 NADH:ubiquinone reductase (Na(+)-transporting) subunit C [Bacteroidales bacterium]MDD3960809.1 NADH:ubiquinone reductase (Na(+)-transporting) subunit C [Bacteroidales bacterium]
MYSNGYIFRFAIIMVVIVAALLSGASMVLKPMQEKNVTTEKMQNILAAAEVVAGKENTLELYNQYIVREVVLNLEGNEVCRFEAGKLITGECRAFDIELKTQLKNLQAWQAGNKQAQVMLPLYVFNDGEKTLYIIPMQGKGLWGPIYGTIALEEDLNTIFGAVFSHKGETPGLGAEIAQKDFQDQFKNKQLYDDGTFVSINVVKGGVANSNINPLHGVDAISGGTITSNGVTEMLKSTFELYVPYFEKRRL